jgi:N-acetylmuramoyl-L-alanine amidase
MSPHLSLQYRVVALDNARWHGGTRPRSDIKYVVMHDTVGGSARSSMNYLNTTTDKKASYHYIIERDGTIYRMCRPEVVAYHAGDSAWPDPVHYPPGNSGHSVNTVSLGIAFANNGDGEKLTPSQIESGLWLCSVFVGPGKIPIQHVLAHKEVSPGRKTDPTSISIDAWRAMLVAYLDLSGVAPVASTPTS